MRISPLWKAPTLTDEPADRLRRARIAAGYTTAGEAASAWQWGVAGYRHHENGIRPYFEIDSAVKYASAYRVGPAWLMGLETNPTAAVEQVNGRALDEPPRGLDHILSALKDRNIRQVDIARALDLPASRVAEMCGGKRKLKLTEARKLHAVFGESPPQLLPAVPTNEVIATILEVLIAGRSCEPTALAPALRETLRLIADEPEAAVDARLAKVLARVVLRK